MKTNIYVLKTHLSFSLVRCHFLRVPPLDWVLGWTPSFCLCLATFCRSPKTQQGKHIGCNVFVGVGSQFNLLRQFTGTLKFSCLVCLILLPKDVSSSKVASRIRRMNTQNILRTLLLPFIQDIAWFPDVWKPLKQIYLGLTKVLFWNTLFLPAPLVGSLLCDYYL